MAKQSKGENMSAKLTAFGNGYILITNEEFASGYQAGHLAFMAERRSIPCSDEELTALFLKRLEDMAYTSLYGMGFLVGWLTTLANKGLKPSALDMVTAPSANLAGYAREGGGN